MSKCRAYARELGCKLTPSKKYGSGTSSYIAKLTAPLVLPKPKKRVARR